jgi:hypothetical protein
MGSHYSQCFATRQTIAPGDKCYAMAVTQMSTYGTIALSRRGEQFQAEGISRSAIWPDAYWAPVSNLIEGRYRLNGDIEITENDENFRRLFAFTQLMLQSAFVTEEGENSTHDLPFDFPSYVKENCPVLQEHFGGMTDASPKDAGGSFNKEDKAKVFAEMVDAWTYTDNVAFKHRVFYADYQNRPRPLQFTLLHGSTYDTLLTKVSSAHAAEVYADKALAVLEEKKASGIYPPEKMAKPEMRELLEWLGPFAMTDVVHQLGEFHCIRYHEKLLGFAEYGVQYMLGKLARAKLHKLMVPVFRDRLVVHMLESYEIKIQPKSIRYEDDKNHIGKGYAALVSQVSESAVKRRKRSS